MNTPLLELNSYPEYGFDILELILFTGNVQTRRYRVFWHCCRQEGEATQRALYERMKKATLTPCVICTRKNNGRTVFAWKEELPPLDLFTPNIPSRPTFPQGVVSAALAWPVPRLLRVPHDIFRRTSATY